MWGSVWGSGFTYGLHCSSFLGLPFRILNVKMVKPRKGTTMETIGRIYLNPEEPTFLGFLIIISLYKSLKR